MLINRYDIREQTLLDQAERDVTALTIHTIKLSHPPFTLQSLCHIHYCLFNELYSWAGQIRDISISKGETRFCQPAFILREAEKLCAKLACERWLEQADHEAFCHQVACITASSISCIPFGKETVGHYAFCSNISFFTQAIR